MEVQGKRHAFRWTALMLGALTTGLMGGPVPAWGATEVACPPTEPDSFCTLEGHKDWVRSVAFHPGGRVLASSGTDSLVKLWDLTTGKELRSQKAPAGFVDELAFSPDGTLLAGSSGKFVILWDVRSGEETRRLEGHERTVYTLAFSPDGRTLVSGATDHSVRLWDPATGRQLGELLGMTSSVEGVTFNPDGSQVAAVAMNNKALVWDLATGQQRTHIAIPLGWAKSTYVVLFSRDGRLLLTGSSDDRVRLWDAASGQAVHTIHDPAAGVYSIALSPDGRLLAADACGDKRKSTWRSCARADVKLWAWKEASHELLRTLTDPEADSTHRVSFSPDGRLLAVGADDWVRIWFVGDLVQAAAGALEAPAPVLRDESSAAKIARLLVALYSEDAAARLAAAGELEKFGPEAAAAAPDLTQLARQDPDGAVRRMAARALEAIGARQAQPLSRVPPAPPADPLIGSWRSPVTMQGTTYYEILTFLPGGRLSASLQDAHGRQAWQGKGSYRYENAQLTTQFAGDTPKKQPLQWQGADRFSVPRGGTAAVFTRSGQ